MTFLNHGTFSQKMATLVDRVSTSWPDEVPHPYKRFLSNICKLSSVAGYLQVLSVEPLNFLKDFCHQMLDLRSAANNLKMKLSLSSTFNIILKLIFLRKNTFSSEAVRAQGDYVEWEIGKSGDIPRNILSGM